MPRYSKVWVSITIGDDDQVYITWPTSRSPSYDIPELEHAPLSAQTVRQLDARGVRFCTHSMDDLEKAQRLGVLDCIRCGACEERLVPRGDEFTCRCNDGVVAPGPLDLYAIRRQELPR